MKFKADKFFVLIVIFLKIKDLKLSTVNSFTHRLAAEAGPAITKQANANGIVERLE